MVKLNSFCGFLSACFVLLVVLFGIARAEKMKKEEFIEKLKQMNVTWKTGLNSAEMPANYSRASRGKKQMCRGCRVVLPKSGKPPPRFFDTRNKWRTTCATVLNRIRHQGQCDSSWAVATVSMLSDRMCIATGGRIHVHLSAEYVLNCCKSCRINGNPGCQGGAPAEAVQYWINTGLVTGGEADTHEGCMPYSKDSFNGMNQDCPSGCTNPNYPKSTSEDCYRGGELYTLPPHQEAIIRQELFVNGPVVAQMTVYEDLEFYKSSVYVHILGDQQGIHYVKIIGYGVEDGKKYWLVANSHGPSFGSNGFVKILRGVNHCNIEDSIIGVKVKKAPEPEPTEPEEEEEETTTEDEVDVPAERQAAISDDGEVWGPSLGKYVMLELIFVYLYLNLYASRDL